MRAEDYIGHRGPQNKAEFNRRPVSVLPKRTAAMTFHSSQCHPLPNRTPLPVLHIQREQPSVPQQTSQAENRNSLLPSPCTEKTQHRSTYVTRPILRSILLRNPYQNALIGQHLALRCCAQYSSGLSSRRHARAAICTDT